MAHLLQSWHEYGHMIKYKDVCKGSKFSCRSICGKTSQGYPWYLLGVRKKCFCFQKRSFQCGIFRILWKGPHNRHSHRPDGGIHSRREGRRKTGSLRIKQRDRMERKGTELQGRRSVAYVRKNSPQHQLWGTFRKFRTALRGWHRFSPACLLALQLCNFYFTVRGRALRSASADEDP